MLEAEDAFSDLVGVVEVRWGEGLAGEDREVDLDLVEPRGMAREMHEHEVGPGVLEAGDYFLAAVDVPLSTTQKTRCATA